MRLPGKDSKSPLSFPFGTPYVEIRDALARESEELFRRNSVLGLIERDATTKRAPERWQALASEEVASFDVVVCFESRVFDLVVEGTLIVLLSIGTCSSGRQDGGLGVGEPRWPLWRGYCDVYSVSGRSLVAVVADLGGDVVLTGLRVFVGERVRDMVGGDKRVVRTAVGTASLVSERIVLVCRGQEESTAGPCRKQIFFFLGGFDECFFMNILFFFHGCAMCIICLGHAHRCSISISTTHGAIGRLQKTCRTPYLCPKRGTQLRTLFSRVRRPIHLISARRFFFTELFQSKEVTTAVAPQRNTASSLSSSVLCKAMA